MKQKKSKNLIQTYHKTKIMWFVIACVLVLFFVLSCFYIQFMKKLTYQNVYHNITELSEQTATQLNLTIKNQEKFVEIMVDSINSGFFQTIDEIFNRFKADLEGYHFTRFVILDEYGNGKTSDGYIVSDYKNIEEFFAQDDIHLSENRPSTISNSQVNIYSKTFEFKGKKMVLFATINTENYKDILSRRLFNGEGGTYLVNNDGQVLIDSFDQITSSSTILYDHMKDQYQLKKQKDLDKIEQMKQNIKQKKAGTFDIILDKRVHFIHYHQVDVNDWYVITIAPDSTIAKELSVFLGMSLGLCFFMNVIIILIFIYIYISNQKKNQKIYEIAYIDPITLLGNEIYFKENCLPFLESQNKDRYVAIIDINKFKAFNKMYGYEFCNRILNLFGETLIQTLPEENLTCRISRDVFAVAFHYTPNVKILVDKIISRMDHFRLDQVDLHLNISIGIYRLTKEDHDIHKVLDKAYMAHSQIKGVYSARYYVFDDALEQRFLEEQKIESDMMDALKNKEFKVFYQPKIKTNGETLAGAEALVRWYKDDTLIPPNKFIPLFEKNKFIIKLDLYVFEQVCKDIAMWKETYGFAPVISVNLSKEHFVDDMFIQSYIEITDQYGIDRSKIDLEITESSTVDENIDILKILTFIKESGFLLSIDDFGTGYSSLSMLQNLPVDILKIDKTFIDNADLTSTENVINHIIVIAQHLGLKTIVEGIETKEQVEFVKRIEGDMIQGYYYSKPITREEFEEFFNQYNQES